MRLLTMLATAVLLAACVHDTEDFDLFAAESGASLTYYIGSEKADHDDPWNTIRENVGTGKLGEEDPWNRIHELFPLEVWGGKSGEEDPWNRINSLFPSESVHRGKTNERYFLGFEKSVAVFLSFTYEVSTADRARVVEVRGNVLKLEFADGVVQYVIDAPGSWVEGTLLETRFVDAASEKDRPFSGVRFWRMVQGSTWGLKSRSLVAEAPAARASEYHASGAFAPFAVIVDLLYL